MCYNVFKEVKMRLFELLLEKPINTVVLTLCICMVIFIAGVTLQLIIQAIRGKEEKDETI